jgi:hypothetical protein
MDHSSQEMPPPKSMSKGPKQTGGKPSQDVHHDENRQNPVPPSKPKQQPKK